MKKVEVPKHDRYTMIQGYYITAIDYVVDKKEIAKAFAANDTNKLDYSMMSGWTNPNQDGWVAFEKIYENDFVIPEAEEGEEAPSFIIDTTSVPEGGQIMIKIGDKDQAIIRKQQGYYNGSVLNKDAIDKIEPVKNGAVTVPGLYKFTLREGATIKKGQALRIYMPYSKDHPDNVYFLESNNATKKNQGAATIWYDSDKNIRFHIYSKGQGLGKKDGTFKVIYTPKGETKQKTINFTKNSIKTEWRHDDKNKVLKTRNYLSGLTGGEYTIDTSKLEPGADVIIEAYDGKGNKVDEWTSYFRYVNVPKAKEKYTDLTWTDHSEKSSILSILSSMYVPYQEVFTNDYAKGTDDHYIDPRVDTNATDFMKDTTDLVGFTKYEAGKINIMAVDKDGKIYNAKSMADANEYKENGEIKGTDVAKNINIDDKAYRAFEYKVELNPAEARAMLLRANEEEKEEVTSTPLNIKLKKDMRLIANASDGSSIPSAWKENRVRTRVFFDATDGKLAEGEKNIRVVPDNIKFLDEEGYKANGFTGEGVQAGTGDSFVTDPTAKGKTFLGWVTADGKQALGDKTIVKASEFEALDKENIFTEETPVESHQVVYAIWSEEKLVTFDANGGSFTGDKTQLTDDLTDGVQAPKEPTQERKTFLGWATTADATEPNADLGSITEPTTLYAVWEDKVEETELKLNDPAPVKVDNKDALTEDEKTAVKEAVKTANPDLPEDAEITVDDKGNVSVKSGNKSGNVDPSKTVKEKTDTEKVDPVDPEKTKVENPSSLTPEEKQAVEAKVKEANKDKFPENTNVVVGDDGEVTITYPDGTTDTIPASKTVEKMSDTERIDPITPDNTTVANPEKLTDEEKDAVKKAIEDINKDKFPEETNVEIADDGTATITYPDESKDEIPGKKLVQKKEEDSAKYEPNLPEKTKVSDLANLTEEEKETVKAAVEAANKDNLPQKSTVTVADNGEVTVTYPDGSIDTIKPADTIEEKTDAEKTDPTIPEKTKVKDPANLTEEEKNVVKKAIEDANTNKFSQETKVEVGNDGKATITYPDGTVDEIKGTDLVDKKPLQTESIDPINPVKTKVEDPENLTEDEKTAVKAAVEEANKDKFPEGTKVEVKNNGDVTITYPDGSTDEIKKAFTVKKKTDAEKTDLQDPAITKVEDPKKLTEDEKTKVKAAVEDANTLPEGTTIDVVDDGKVTVNYPDGSSSEITPDKTVEKDTELKLNDPEKPIEVKDPANLTDEEKQAVKDALKKTNPDLTDEDIKVNNDGSVDVTKGDKKGSLPADKTVEESKTLDLRSPETTKVKDKENLTNEEKEAIKAKVKAANPTLSDNAEITVADNGEVSIKDGQKSGTIPANRVIEEYEDITLNKPAEIVTVKDPNKLTDKEKEAVKQAVKDANPQLPESAEITVADDGTVTATNGNKNAKLGPELTVEQKADKEALQTEAGNEDQVKEDPKYINADKDKKDAYDKALVHAKDILKDPKASQESVDKALEDLQKAKEALNGEETNKEALKAQADKDPAIKETTKYKNADQDKKDSYAKAFENAKNVLEDPKASQAQVDKALEDLKAAENELNGTADKSKLQDERGQAADVQADDKYKNADEDKKNAYDKALEYANKVLNDPDASQEDVDKALADLQKAKEALNGEATDKTKLQAESDKEEEIKQTPLYKNADEDKKAAYDEKLDQAKKVLADKNATQENVNKALKELKDARNALNGQATNKEALKAEANQADPTKATDAYKLADQELKDAYDKALEEANKVIADPEATQAEVDKALEELQKAKAALNGVADKSKLQAEADKEEATKSSDAYKNADKNLKDAYDKALEEANNVLSNPDATQDEIDQAQKALEDARNALNGQATDKEALKEEANQADPTKETDAYKLASEDKKKAYDDALVKAGEVLADDNASQAEVDKALEELQKAKEALDGKADTPSEVDKAKLQDQADKEESVKSEDRYKNADKEKQAAYDEALAAAKEILQDPKASQEQIDNALKALQGAEAALNGETQTPSEVDKAPLQAESDKSDEIKSNDVYKNADKDKKDAYDQALEEAKRVLADENASQDEIDQALAKLEKAKAELNGETEKPEEVDKSKLQAESDKESAVKDTDKYKNADKEKQAAYDEALAAAKKVLADPNATQEQIDKALKALQDAESALDGKTETPSEVDKSKLQAESDEEKSIKESDAYKNAGQDKKDAYDKALEEANKILSDENATQDQVNKALKALADAEKALDGKASADSVDKSKLQTEADNEGLTKETDKYKKASVDKKKAYDDALAAAKTVLADPNATQEDVNKAFEDLKKAENALDGKAESTDTVHKSELDSEAKKDSTVKDADRYKNASKDKKDAYDKALDAAKKVLANPNASQAEIDKALEELKKAEDALDGKTYRPETPSIFDTNKDALKAEANKEIPTKETEAYKKASADKKAAYDKALEAAQKVLEDPNATQEQIDAALKALKDAEADLDGKLSEEVDKSKLEAEIKKEADLKLSADYKKASTDKQAAYDEALAAAKAILEDTKASQDQVDKAEKSLAAARADLGQKTGQDSELSDKYFAKKPDKKVKVANIDKLSDKEKAQLIDEVKKANPMATKVVFGEDGKLILEYGDGSRNSLSIKELIDKAAEDPAKDIPAKAKAGQKAKATDNVKTGVGSVTGILGVLGAAAAGLFATRKKEDEDK